MIKPARLLTSETGAVACRAITERRAVAGACKENMHPASIYEQQASPAAHLGRSRGAGIRARQSRQSGHPSLERVEELGSATAGQDQKQAARHQTVDELLIGGLRANADVLFKYVHRMGGASTDRVQREGGLWRPRLSRQAGAAPNHIPPTHLGWPSGWWQTPWLHGLPRESLPPDQSPAGRACRRGGPRSP